MLYSTMIHVIWLMKPVSLTTKLFGPSGMERHTTKVLVVSIRCVGRCCRWSCSKRAKHGHGNINPNSVTEGRHTFYADQTSARASPYVLTSRPAYFCLFRNGLRPGPGSRGICRGEWRKPKSGENNRSMGQGPRTERSVGNRGMLPL